MLFSKPGYLLKTSAIVLLNAIQVLYKFLNIQVFEFQNFSFFTFKSIYIVIIENLYVENTSPSFHFKSRTEHGPFVVLFLSFLPLAWLESSLSSWIPPFPLFPEASQWPSLACFIFVTALICFPLLPP